MKRLILTAIICILSIHTLKAQFITGQENQVLMKAAVLDETTKQPVSINILIEAPDGKKYKLSSNPDTGEFEQLLAGGKTYELTFSGENIFRTKQTITTETTKEYLEQNFEFHVNQILPGNRIYNIELFDDGSAELSSKANKMLNDIKMNLRFNRSVYLDFLVKGDDPQLLSSRKKKIEDLVNNWHASKKRIQVKEGNGNADKNFAVYVNKIDNPFD